MSPIGRGMCASTQSGERYPLRGARLSFGAKVRSIGQYTSEHYRNIFWDVAGPNMRELIRKAGPFMHFP